MYVYYKKIILLFDIIPQLFHLYQCWIWHWFLDSCSSCHSLISMSLTPFFHYAVLLKSFILSITLAMSQQFSIFKENCPNDYEDACLYSYWHQAPCNFVLAHQLSVFSCFLFYSQGNFESLIWKMFQLLTQHHWLIQWNVNPLQVF